MWWLLILKVKIIVCILFYTIKKKVNFFLHFEKDQMLAKPLGNKNVLFIPFDLFTGFLKRP